MALSLDWENRIISISRADMALTQSTPSEIREQSLVNLFSLLREQEATGVGMLYPPILNYSKPQTLGGVTLAPVVSIINGYSITFEDGQYAVNLVGANSNVADCANVNQVSVRSANSAGLVQTREIEQAAFGDKVAINQSTGVAGTAYPIGTMQRPCNNWIDAKFIADLRGLDTFHIIGNYTVGPTDIISGYKMIGNGPENTTVTLSTGCTTSKTTFEEMSISGRQNGETHYHSCDIGALTNVHCQFIDCRLLGPMTMHQSYADTTALTNCSTGDVAGATFVVDLNNSPCHMSFNNFYGKMQFINMNKATAGIVTVNMGAGKILIDSTCTTGQIKIRGNGEVVDTSTGTVVDNDVTANLVSVSASALTPEQATMIEEARMAALMALAEARLARQLASNKVAVSTDDKLVTIYADDGSTILHQFNISDDKRVRTPASAAAPAPDQVVIDELNAIIWED